MSTRTLREEVRAATYPDGTRALVIDVAIPDEAPDDIREGLARRRIVNSGRPCPCGARPATVGPNRAARRAGAPDHRRVVIEHEHDCPAADDYIRPRLAEWGRGAS